MSAKATQYSKMVITSALALPLILSLFSLNTPAKADLQFFQRFNVVGADGTWPTLGIFVEKDSRGGASGVDLFGGTPDGLFFAESAIPSNSFQTTPSLHTATLSVTVDAVCLISPSCGSVPLLHRIPLTIQATWGASGPFGPPGVPHQVLHFGFKGAELVDSIGATVVPATATGILNGQNLGQSDPSFTDLFKAAEVTIKTCPSTVASGHAGQCEP